MKKLFYLLTAAVLLLTSCREYDDSELWKSIDELRQRIEAVETVLNAYENKLFIESVNAIENGYVIIFSDGSKATIVNGEDGSAGKDGDTYIASLVVGEDEVTFTLTDGETFSIPIYSALSIHFDTEDLVVMNANSTRDIHYTVKSLITDVVVEVLSSPDIRAKVIPSDENDCSTGIIKVSTDSIVDEYSKVVVLVSNGEKVIMRCITFEEPGLKVGENAVKKATAKGGELALEFLSNVECEAVVPEDAQSWISVMPATRTLERQSITIRLEPNTGHNRSAIVTVQYPNGCLKLEYQVEQEGDLGIYIDPADVPDNEIWYTTKDHSLFGDWSYYKTVCGGEPFDRRVISHTYTDGLGKIVFDGLLTRINPGAFSSSPKELTNIYMPNSVEYIGADAFADCKQLKSVMLPSALKQLDSYAFRGCTSIEGFYGNENFHSEDNKCLFFEQNNPYLPINWNGKWICGFAGHGLSEYTIPDGVVGIENYAFEAKTNLRSVTIPGSVVHVGSYAFYECRNLEAVYGPNVSEDNRAFVYDNEFGPLIARKKMPANYHIPDNATSIGYQAFTGCSQVKSITMGDQITEIGGYAFSGCPNLKKVVLSANCKTIGDRDGMYPGYNPFLASNIEVIYCRALTPPLYYDEQMSDFPNLKFYVPEQSLAVYQNNAGWSLYRKYFVGYKYDDLPENDTYISSDYSKNGVVTTLQTATKGDGIDIVLMGDAYSDRQIADGTYKADMENLYNSLFTEEPYKSFKDHFNVYYINVVSATEGYEYGNTALDGYFGDGTLVGGNDNAVFDYALKAISEEEMDEALLIVAMNSNNYAGTCYMYYPETNADYGKGVSVSYFPRGGESTTFAQLLHHEACGHGFAKLADEYAYEDMGTAPNDYVSQIKEQQTNWGWWKNVDFTNNPLETRWSHFINDTRYANEGLGAYEGGLTYWNGVWRPTENSIMNTNTGGFNAPSREAIYYRIHKLAYGDSWEYDYEEFVEWDAKNRKAEADAALLAPYRKASDRNFVPLHPPVVRNKSWRDAK